jgi:hypothetical protein
MDAKNGVVVPTVWNEREVSLGIERYRGNENLLGRYVDGIMSRFVTGQPS